MKFVVVISLMLASLQVSAQWTFDDDKLSDEAKAIVFKIKNDKSVPSDTMGIRFGHLDKDYPLTLLRQKLTIDELSLLTNHPIPIVRCYGFKALTQSDESMAFQIVTKHLQDTTEISTHYGCFGSDEFVGDYFVSMFRGFEAITHDSLHLNSLDSLLIFTPNKLEARQEAIRRAGKRGRYYDRIKEIAINDKSAGAIVALALFNRPEDVDIIMNTKVTGAPSGLYSMATTFFAISQFPHPRFLPFLENHLAEIMTKPSLHESAFLYHAIINYNSKEASALLGRAFAIRDKELRRRTLEDLSRILKRNTNPVYNDLRKRIAAEVRN